MKEKRNRRDPVQNTLTIDDLRQRAEDVLRGAPLEITDLSARELDFILHAFEEAIQIDDQQVLITISQGVAQATQEDYLNSLLKKADDSLYEAKASGRNQIKAARIAQIKFNAFHRKAN